jgi:prolyl-tRNA synthetase
MAKEKDIKGLVSNRENFGDWFSELIVKADLADYTDVSGSIIFKPRSWAIWEKIRELCDIRFKKAGIQNVYFPLLIPEKYLNMEKDHVEGFAPEVAWVEKAGNTKLTERLAIRPTSEAIMYPSFSKWIRSWRDLPLKYNQWVNVVRWEFNNPVPFLRTREFVFNEIHTVHSNEKDAISEGKEIMEAYKDVCENYLALYSVEGRKTDKEKFAGAVYTNKLHHVMPNGKAIEGCAFHHDGQKFAKAYNITFLDEKEMKCYAYQNTAAISTRNLGILFAVHSDEKGLIIPPRVAPKIAVIIPILVKGKEKDVIEKAKELQESLGVDQTLLDDRKDKRPGEKFSEWELKGIPLRIEIGPKDLEEDSVIVIRRDNSEKSKIKIKDLEKKVPIILEEIQKSLYEKSKKNWKSSLSKADTLEDLKKSLGNRKIVLVPLTNSREVEDQLKDKTGGKTLFIAKEKPTKTQKCIISGETPDYLVYVAKTY